MIVFSELSLRRGPKALLESTSFSIHPGQKVGLTGANGVGKSSLFALIRGELGQDSGVFSMPPAWVLAHVKQETPSSTQTALEYALQGDAEYVNLQVQIAEAEGARLGELHARLDAIDGYTAESRAATLLHGLGFKPEEMQRPVSSFSGGWRMRLNLAQALMCRSDLLLLDEPTNHLDLPAQEVLETVLTQFDGTILLISHDRYLVNQLATEIWDLRDGSLTIFTGTYAEFMAKGEVKATLPRTKPALTLA